MKNKDKLDSEAAFLADYDSHAFDTPLTSVDVTIFTVKNNQLHVLLVKRADHPFKEKWALPAGFIDLTKDKDLEATAKRKLKEKTGVLTPYLEQAVTIGNNKRDPRGWSVTVVYFALLSSENLTLSAGEGAVDIKWAPIKINEVADKLAFDHVEILKACIDRLKNKVKYTSLPVHLLPKEFTLKELQDVYETILATKLEKKSFRRRILDAGILEEAGDYRYGSYRPAMLYRIKKDHEAYFFPRIIEGSRL